MTADNSFECWVNGRSAGSGDDFGHRYKMDVALLLKPGANVISVVAINGGDAPNPAGLVARLRVAYDGGQAVEVLTDAHWEAAEAATGNWRNQSSVGGAWAARDGTRPRRHGALGQCHRGRRGLRSNP